MVTMEQWSKLVEVIGWVQDALPEGYTVQYAPSLDQVTMGFFHEGEEVAFGWEYINPGADLQDRILTEAKQMAKRARITLSSQRIRERRSSSFATPSRASMLARPQQKEEER